MKRNNSANVFNLDPLLDIVSNVVGFLVIILVVVCILSSNLPLPKEIESQRVRKNQLETDIIELKVRLESLVIQLQKTTDILSAQQSIDSMADDKESLENMLKTLINKQGRIKSEIETAETRLARLNKKLNGPQSKNEVNLIPSISIVSLSNDNDVLVPSWKNKECVNFLCRYGRIFPFDIQDLLTKLGEVVNDSASSLSIYGTKNLQRDLCENLSYHFSNNTVGNNFFKIKVIDMPKINDAQIVFECKNPKSGVSIHQLKRKRNLFTKHLSKISSKKVWIKFLVWQDSFEIFIKAHKISKKQKFEIGWLPYSEDEDIKSWLFRSLLSDDSSNSITEGPQG
ncbi:MAG: hypothetical protein OMM_03332 [Candidatus Magnetoglobus multicellularis str. Araruama]|uniref:Uncharacterized protein n=1 Tax=Candidatus Magnetoglobus multicellularis str. Araruama TaxID=890399 RepID=A0A1V1P5Y8_9BACT|nr:MAG: hypothetical protein OMM_03332 [Candidatus Magnetoglobus multicellularis str. Araruama]